MAMTRLLRVSRRLSSEQLEGCLGWCVFTSVYSLHNSVQFVEFFKSTLSCIRSIKEWGP